MGTDHTAPHGWSCDFGVDMTEMLNKAADFAKMTMHGGHRGGARHFGPGSWFGPWFKGAPGPFGGMFRHGHPGPLWAKPAKAKRGDVRAAILALLSEAPRNGYQIIQEVHERSGGAWKPSPGAVYPALQQLADEGLVRGEEGDGRRTFHLTEAGRTYVAEHADELTAVWEGWANDLDANAEVSDLFDQVAQCGAALMQIVHTGDERDLEQARKVLADARRRLYLILAEGDDSDDDASNGGTRPEEDRP